MDKLAIQSQVKYKREGLKKRRAVKREQEQTRLLINGQNTKNPERAQHLRAAKAEETLIASLMRNPDFYNKLKDGLSADYFVTALNRRIFSVVLSRLKRAGIRSRTFSLPSLRPTRWTRSSAYSVRRRS